VTDSPCPHMDSLKELGEVLLKIHTKLVKEGKLKRIDNKWVFFEDIHR
jgi:hypothetical protein